MSWANGRLPDTFFICSPTNAGSLSQKYREEDWERFGASPFWPDVSLRWVVTKTLQHTFEHTNNVLQIGLFWDFLGETN